MTLIVKVDGPKLKQYRQEMKLSLRKLSERCGITRQTIGSLESGVRTKATVGTVQQIVSALNEYETEVFVVKRKDAQIIDESDILLN